MKIIFICGCLEQGKDGVGDYVHHLAGALIKKGHNIQLLAINENFDSTPVGLKDGFIKLSNDSGHIASLRIHNSKLRKRNIRRARSWISQFDPDLISLQYVPYSFNKKGVAWKLSRELRFLAEDRSWHIMFHEVWIGISKVSSVKHRVIGFVQKKIAYQLVQNLNCSIITTSNLLYQLVLQSAGIKSKILPLFSNIPKTPIDEDFRNEVFRKIKLTKETAHDFELVGIFGTLKSSAKLENVLQEMYVNCSKNNKKLILISVGEIGSQGITELHRLKSYFANKVLFYHFGPQPATHVSTIFQILDSAISCTPSYHIPKSGVFAAMKLHNLKIYTSNHEVLPEYDEKVGLFLKKYMDRPTEDWMVETVSDKFLSFLYSSSKTTRSKSILVEE